MQKAIGNDDGKARQIFATIAHFYPLKDLLLLGRVTSGEGGEIMLDTAQNILHKAYPEVADGLQLHTPDEASKRDGQAVAAASLPTVPAQN